MTGGNTQRTVYVFMGVFFLTSIALRGAKMLVALGALDEGANELTIGMLAAAFAIFPLFLSVHAGRISDRIGCLRPTVLGGLAMALSLALPFLSLSLTNLFLCPVILGLGQIFIQVSVHNAVGAMSAPTLRTRNYATLALAVSLAAFVGPLTVGATVDHLGLHAGFALLAVVAALISVPALMFAGRIEPRKGTDTESERKRMLDLFGHAGLRRVVLMSGTAMCGVELFAFYIPIYGTSIGLSATAIGAVLAAHAAAAVVVRLGTGVLLKRMNEITLLTAALFLAGAGFAVIPMSSDVTVLFAISFLLGLGLGIASPLTLSLTYDNAPDGRSGEALGLRISVNKVTQIAVPLAFGGIGAAFGVAPVFWANAAILLLGGAVSTVGLRRRRG